MATALLDKANALAASNKIDPTLNTFDESKGVAGRVNQIASQDGPLMQLASTGAKQQANKLGMRNSSLAIGAGQKAVLEAATPIANADAGLYQQQQLANQNASNNASTANSTNAITAGMRGIELGENSRQFDASTALNSEQFNAAQRQQTEMAHLDIAAKNALADKDVNARRELASMDIASKAYLSDKDADSRRELANMDIQSRAYLAGVDRDTKLQLANVEATFKNDIQNSANISNAWGSMMERIGQVQNNPDLDAAAKTTLINNNIGAFKSFAAFWNKAAQVDVSDLLKISAASAGGGTTSPAPAPGPAPAPPPPNEPYPYP